MGLFAEMFKLVEATFIRVKVIRKGEKDKKLHVAVSDYTCIFLEL